MQQQHFLFLSRWVEKAQQGLEGMQLPSVSSVLKSPKIFAGLTLSLVLLGGLTYVQIAKPTEIAIVVNGKELGVVPDLTTGRSLIDTVLLERGQSLGLPAKTHAQILYKKVSPASGDESRSSLDRENLARELEMYFDGYQLTVNGSVIACLSSKEDAEKVLKDYQEYYIKAGEENKVSSVTINENIDIVKADIRAEQMQQPDQVSKLLIEGKSVVNDYIVQEKDSWWLIARKHNMLTVEVLAGNPGATKDTKLKPGQVVKLVNTEPYLTVISKGMYSGTVTLPYDVETKTDSNLASGQTKVIKAGVNGSKIVSYSYEQKNGVDVKKEVLDEKVIKEPITQIIAKGSANRPITVAYAASRGGNDSSSLVDRALKYVGTAYVFGGTGRSGFDCSGFTKYVYAESGKSLPRTSYEQFASGSSVSLDQARPGDLVFFSTYASGASHVGIYIGGGRFVHASNPRSGVKVTAINDSFYSPRFLGVRRY